MEDDNVIGWLVLGAALVSQEFRVRLNAISDGAEFAGPRIRAVFNGQASGRDVLTKALANIQVFLRDKQICSEALLDAVLKVREQRAMKTLANRISDASTLMKPEEFRQFVLKETAALRKQNLPSRNGN